MGVLKSCLVQSPTCTCCWNLVSVTVLRSYRVTVRTIASLSNSWDSSGEQPNEYNVSYWALVMNAVRMATECEQIYLTHEQSFSFTFVVLSYNSCQLCNDVTQSLLVCILCPCYHIIQNLFLNRLWAQPLSFTLVCATTPTHTEQCRNVHGWSRFYWWPVQCVKAPFGFRFYRCELPYFAFIALQDAAMLIIMSIDFNSTWFAARMETNVCLLQDDQTSAYSRTLGGTASPTWVFPSCPFSHKPVTYRNTTSSAVSR